MKQLGHGRQTVLVTGTNGKSTTTRMTAAALETIDSVVTQADGANMDAGIVAALATDLRAPLAAIEVDELHTPHVADPRAPRDRAAQPHPRPARPGRRDQHDRAEAARGPEAASRRGDRRELRRRARHVRRLRQPERRVGRRRRRLGQRLGELPRTGEPIVREGDHWYSTGSDFARPTPDWWVDDESLYGPDGLVLPLKLTLPGRANRGNAAQAVAAAVALGADPAKAVAAASVVEEVAGRYKTVQVGPHSVHMLLAKNPAGWQEALSMIDPTVDGLVIAVNGQVPDGEDLSWLWDVRFEHFEGVQVVAAGERGTDLAVRLTYAGVEHTLVPDPLKAIASCPPGRVEVLANYTAFRDLNTAIARRAAHV